MREAAIRGYNGKKRRFQNTNKTRWKGMRYWRVRARKTRLISQTLYELSGVTYSVLSQVKMEPQIPEPINHHEGAHNTGKKLLVFPFHGQFPRKIHLQCH